MRFVGISMADGVFPESVKMVVIQRSFSRKVNLGAAKADGGASVTFPKVNEVS